MIVRVQVAAAVAARSAVAVSVAPASRRAAADAGDGHMRTGCNVPPRSRDGMRSGACSVRRGECAAEGRAAASAGPMRMPAWALMMPRCPKCAEKAPIVPSSCKTAVNGWAGRGRHVACRAARAQAHAPCRGIAPPTNRVPHRIPRDGTVSHAARSFYSTRCGTLHPNRHGCPKRHLWPSHAVRNPRRHLYPMRHRIPGNRMG